MALTKESALDKIKAEAPGRLYVKARWNYFGRIATNLVGGEVGYGLPFDDASKPSRWHGAPAHTLRGVERIARTRRTQEVLSAANKAVADFGLAVQEFGTAGDRGEKTADELEALEAQSIEENKEKNNG